MGSFGTTVDQCGTWPRGGHDRMPSLRSGVGEGRAFAARLSPGKPSRPQCRNGDEVGLVKKPVDLRPGDMKSLHRKSGHADPCNLGMKTSFGRRKYFKIGRPNNCLELRWITKTKNSTQRHCCSPPKQKHYSLGLLHRGASGGLDFGAQKQSRQNDCRINDATRRSDRTLAPLLSVINERILK